MCCYFITTAVLTRLGASESVVSAFREELNVTKTDLLLQKNKTDQLETENTGGHNVTVY